MRAAALDLSSKTGWAAHDGASPLPVLGTKPIVGWGYDAGSMLELYRKWLSDFVKIHRPEVMFIEAWFIAPHLDAVTIGKQVALATFTQWAMKTAGIPTHLITVNAWRNGYFGSAAGKADYFKRKAMRYCDELGLQYPDHNAAEAMGILDHGLVSIARVMPPWRKHPVFLVGAEP